MTLSTFIVTHEYPLTKSKLLFPLRNTNKAIHDGGMMSRNAGGGWGLINYECSITIPKQYT